MNMKKLLFLPAVALWLLTTLPLVGFVLSAAGKADANEPRIVNIYNFVRNSDYRVPDSEEVLYETTRKQIELIKLTLEQLGEWFRHKYIVTPPTAVVALDDWKHENRKTVWYDSRFYRLNVLWENGHFFIRDLHCFDPKVVSP